MGKAVKFCRVPRYRELEIMEREHTIKINDLYLGDSGTIYFVIDDNIDFNNNLQYNNNIEDRKVSFVESISKNEMKICGKEREENPFINLDFDWEL